MKKSARPYWIRWVNLGWLPTQPLVYSPSFLNGQEKKVRQEGLWDKIKTGTSLSSCCHKQKGLNLGKSNVIYCQLRIEVDSDKQVQILKHLPVKTSSTYLFFSGTLSPLHPPTLHLLSPRGAGAGARVCGQSPRAPVCCSLPSHTVSCSSVWTPCFPQGAQTWLLGPAMPCGGKTRASWKWHGGPQASPHRPLLQLQHLAM